MLTEIEAKEISSELNRYEQKSASCIEALRVVQRHRGWVSDEAIVDIAEYLEMTPADVDGVATFYNLIFRRPVGTHVLFVCDSVSCWIMGCDKIKNHLTTRLGVNLGKTSKDGSFTILPIACLGTCESSPVLMIDGKTVSNVNTNILDEILTGLQREDTQGKTA
ncbi:MAG: NADH-quinone oxidoreductase subunit NuoE [Bdellovibrionia bacterium]